MTKIRVLTENDWPQVKRIYLEGIATENSTFQTVAPLWEEWDKAHMTACRLVVEEGRDILGWAALSKVSQRAVYSGVAEVSIYIAKEARGKGIGTLLFLQLIEASEREGIWTLQSGIFPENIESINLHKKMGFREIGFREKVGKLHGVWRDVVLMERRSSSVGVS
jgi:L-amino acid N-acyltransferase YncA